MKIIWIVLIVCCITGCKEKPEEKNEIISKQDDGLSILKADIGLPKSYNDTLSLISYMKSDKINYDEKFLKTDYKKKLDSLYELMDEELNIIDFDYHYREDARKAFNQLKTSFINDEKASYDMWNASYGINYKSINFDKNAFVRIEQMIYKRRYEELLIYNFHLRSNLTRWHEDPHTFLYRKRLQEVMPKKVMDSMYPKKDKHDSHN